jgi:hypothetical protein
MEMLKQKSKAMSEPCLRYDSSYPLLPIVKHLINTCCTWAIYPVCSPISPIRVAPTSVGTHLMDRATLDVAVGLEKRARLSLAILKGKSFAQQYLSNVMWPTSL